MKIAAVSDDGVTISQHFGRARYYVVVEVEGGRVVARERRDKLGHAQFAAEPHGAEDHGADPRGHGHDAAAQGRHARMVEAVRDCDVLLARGMGSGAYESMRRAGIRPVITDLADVDEAALAAAAGALVDHTERLH